MPQPVPSTYHILKEKALNRYINESWVNWAREMMEAGFESINLYELAGTTKPMLGVDSRLRPRGRQSHDCRYLGKQSPP